MRYDACIIGSGAGGGPVAAALAEAGYRVLVLEKGPRYGREQFLRDEIVQVQRDMFTPDVRRDPHVVETRDLQGRVRVDEASQDGWNGVCVGGASNVMTGFFLRLKPIDFRQRSELGAVPGAQVADWPISYDELEPWYDRVEKEVGVSGRVVAHRWQEPRSSPAFPLRPLLEHRLAREVDAACKDLGMASVPMPRAVLPDARGGREACTNTGFCGGYGCPTGAKGSSLAAWIPRAEATGRCTVLSQVTARRLVSDGSGRVVAVEALDAKGQRVRVEATVFVLAATAVESARLMLLSTGPRHPRGLANGSGLVGCHLGSTTFGAAWGDFPYAEFGARWPWLADGNPWIHRCIQDHYVVEDERLGRRKGGTISFLFTHPDPIGGAYRLATERGAPLWGLPLKRRLEQWFRDAKHLRFELFCEWLPVRESRVTLDARVRDAWGDPVARMSWVSHPHNHETATFLLGQGRRVLERMGARNITQPLYGGPSSNLLSGTCRFGDDPATSVLDRDCRAHEVDNLYVTDASFMPTSGSVPFTFTIYANALRVADRIARRLAGR
ncbi:MAG: GMC family oxidoreductase [Planctomycetia bacterium]